MESNFSSSQFSITDAEINRMAEEPRLREGTYEFVVLDESVFASKAGGKSAEGTLFLKLKLAPLKSSGDPTSADKRTRIEHLVTLPLKNPNVAGHLPPAYAGGITAEVFAALGLVPSMPRYVNNDADREAKAAVIKASHDVAAALVSEEQSLKGRTMFGTVVHKGKYTNITRMSAELGDRTLNEPPFIND